MTPPRRPQRRRPGGPGDAPPATPTQTAGSFVLSCVDEPQPGARLKAGTVLTGKGWAVSSSPIASIAVELGELLLGYAEYGQPRPEIGRDYAHFPQAHHSGFIFSLTLGPEVERARGADLVFRFCTEDGGDSRRNVPLNWAAPGSEPESPEDAARPWPIRLSLDECRVDGAGRLRLRGWAIGRAPITALHLFLNDVRLHAPETGLARPDIAQRHGAYQGAATAGFRLVQQLEQEAGERDVVRVVVRSGAVQRQIIVPLAGPDAHSRLLGDGRVTLCVETLWLADDGTLSLTGWAVGEADTREIELRGEHGTLGFAEIGLARPDIGNRFPRLHGARHAGFRLRQLLPEPRADAVNLLVRDHDGGERSLSLRLPRRGSERDRAEAGEVVDAALVDAAEPILLRVESPALRHGAAEAPVRGLLTVAGWALAASGIAAVELWQGDSSLGEAFLGIRREDIATAFPDTAGALTAGFALSVPHRRLGDGEHTLRAVVRARSGAVIEYSFRVALASDDDVRLGAIRRLVPQRETALRLDLLAGMGPMPRFVVAVRMAAGADLRPLHATLDSLRRQSLAGWTAIVRLADRAAPAAEELRLAIAEDGGLRGRVRLAAPDEGLWPEAPDEGASELLCTLRAGDRLGADALVELAVEARLSEADFVYADERCHDPGRGGVAALFKPGWSPDLLLSANYIGRAWCATRALADRAGVGPAGVGPARTGTAGVESGGDYDTVLRLTEAARRISHLPLSLFERAGRRLEAPPREHEALVSAARRRGIAAEVLPGLVPGAWRLRRAVDGGVLVSVVIATCGARGLIRRAIETLRGRTGYQPLEIVVLDDIPAEQAELKAWLAANADRVLAVEGPFNWSRFNNLGARAGRGEVLLFLNDDVEATDSGWLEAMMEHAARPEIGVVGARLLYPDGKLQHAGMFMRGAEARHAYRFAAADEPGPFGLAQMQRDVTAVTGACLLVRRAVFERLGGFDEQHGVIMNDVDFCLRVRRAGLGVIYTPHATLIHHEMASRAALADSFDHGRFDAEWALLRLRGDPLLNPNLAREGDDMLAETEPAELIQPGTWLIERAQVRHILVVKLDAGSSPPSAAPALRRLRAGFPGAEITLVCAPDAVAAAQLIDAADQVVPVDLAAHRGGGGRRPLAEIERDEGVARLRAMRFDLAIDLRPQPDTRPVLRLVGASVLAGFDHGGRFAWLDIAVEWEGEPPLVDKRGHLAGALLRLADAVCDAATPGTASLRLADMAREGSLVRLWQSPQLGPAFRARPLVCVQPGGSPLTQWPGASFAGLIRLLLADYDVSVLLVGAAVHAGLGAEIVAACGHPDAVVSVIGKLEGEELPALLASSALVIGNEGATVQLAAALGTASVEVHGGHVDAAERGASGPRAIAVRRRMSCGPCYIADAADCPRAVTCLRGITPAQVYRACRLLLGFTFGGGAAIATSAASSMTASRAPSGAEGMAAGAGASVEAALADG